MHIIFPDCPKLNTDAIHGSERAEEQPQQRGQPQGQGRAVQKPQRLQRALEETPQWLRHNASACLSPALSFISLSLPLFLFWVERVICRNCAVSIVYLVLLYHEVLVPGAYGQTSSLMRRWDWKAISTCIAGPMCVGAAIHLDLAKVKKWQLGGWVLPGSKPRFKARGCRTYLT